MRNEDRRKVDRRAEGIEYGRVRREDERRKEEVEGRWKIR